MSPGWGVTILFAALALLFWLLDRRRARLAAEDEQTYIMEGHIMMLGHGDWADSVVPREEDEVLATLVELGYDILSVECLPGCTRVHLRRRRGMYPT